MIGTQIRLVVKDNGKGFDAREKAKGFGLELVSLLTEQVGGTLRIEQNNGTECILEFETES